MFQVGDRLKWGNDQTIYTVSETKPQQNRMMISWWSTVDKCKKVSEECMDNPNIRLLEASRTFNIGDELKWTYDDGSVSPITYRVTDLYPNGEMKIERICSITGIKIQTVVKQNNHHYGKKKVVETPLERMKKRYEANPVPENYVILKEVFHLVPQMVKHTIISYVYEELKK